MPSFRALSAVVVIGSTLISASAFAGPTSRLIAVNGGGNPKVTYTSTDGSAGIDQGAGTDPAGISATVDVRIDASGGQLLFPAGSAAWLANTDRSAKFRSRGAGAQGFDIVDGKRLKVSGPGFDLLGATTTITVAMAIDDAGEVSTHCVSFEPTECIYRTSATREKIKCKGGTPDPTCGVPPTTTSTSTTPPPSTTSTTLQRVDAPDCCQGSGECRNGLGFTLLSNLSSFCQSALPGSVSKPGNVCGVDGQCQLYTLPAPTNLCCEQSSGCYSSETPVSVGDTAWFFRNNCYGAGGFNTYQGAVCGVSGNCEAE